MPDLDRTKLRRLDLTLLLILLGLLRHRRATAVAAELGLTGSSVSHALGRLRDVFGDELFLRRPHGLVPTAFALAIEPEVRAAVEALDGALRGPPAFDPPTAGGRLRIAARDILLATRRPEGLSALNIIEGIITGLEPSGHDQVDVALDCAGTRLTARITSVSAEMLGLVPGMTVHAVIKTVALDP